MINLQTILASSKHTLANFLRHADFSAEALPSAILSVLLGIVCIVYFGVLIIMDMLMIGMNLLLLVSTSSATFGLALLLVNRQYRERTSQYLKGCVANVLGRKAQPSAFDNSEAAGAIESV